MNRLPVAERREQLIQAALAVASRDGIDAATVRAVAAEAGVSLGVVHYCFQDKDELLRAVADAITTQNLAMTEAAIPPDADLATVLELAVEGLWHGIRDNRGSQLLSYELTTTSLRHSELNQVASDQYRGSRGAVELFLERIEHGAQVSWAVPRSSLARTVVATVDGFALAWLVDGDEEATIEGLHRFAQYLATQTVEFGAPADAQPSAAPLATVQPVDGPVIPGVVEPVSAHA